MAKHFDVVVLGDGLGALAAAALLARRSWRVLVVGTGARPPTYGFEGATLARRPFTFLAGTSPAWSRLCAELAQSQTWKRRVMTQDPMFQVLAPRVRLDVPPDTTLFAREVEREMPGTRAALDDAYARLAEANAAGDAAFDKDCVWPPGGFWERRETDRVAATLPWLDAAGASPVTGDLPPGHIYGRVVDATARFAGHLWSELPAFAVARLHGAWTRGVMAPIRGEEDVAAFLLERVTAHGGEVRARARVMEIVVRRGKVAGVRLDDDDAPTGVDFVVSDAQEGALLDLATGGWTPSRRAMESLPQLAVRGGRYVVSIVARGAGVPAALGRDAFLFPRHGGRRDDAIARAQRVLGAVRLQRHTSSAGIEGGVLLVAEALVPASGEVPMALARDAVLATIEDHLPFVERHYLVIDSPHDGRPLWAWRNGRRREVDRGMLRGAGGPVAAEIMQPLWDVSPRGYGGLTGEPVRAPLPGAFSVGPAVLPALGQEGELLAAWGAARIVTRTDRRKEKMRKEMWSKVEIG